MVKFDALALIPQADDQRIAQGGAVGYLLSKDSCASPLIFGEGGILKLEDTGLAAHDGFGLQIHLKNSRKDWMNFDKG